MGIWFRCALQADPMSWELPREREAIARTAPTGARMSPPPRARRHDGVVLCKVDASFGQSTGGLLVASPTPGHAMHAQASQPGTVIGKPGPLESGTGVIKVLVMMR